MTPPKRRRVVLAYSGGLDTSVAVHWMTAEWDLDVIALAVDVGQRADDSWDTITARARHAGAVDAIVVDARAEFATQYCRRALQANALYEGKYPLVSALSRPVIVKHLVDAARHHDADAVAHGCTGKGNDQVRFEVSTRALAPDLDVLAPVREWGFTRDDSIEYAARHDIPVKVRRDNPYSIDENLWGRTIECGVIEDPWAAPPTEPYTLTADPATAPRTECGARRVVRSRCPRPRSTAPPSPSPSSSPPSPTPSADTAGVASIWSRTVGSASRAARSTSAPDHSRSSSPTPTSSRSPCERDLLREKARLEPRYAELVYDGLWFSPLRRALDAFIATTQEPVTGDVATPTRTRGAAPSSAAEHPRASTTTSSPPTTPPTSSATRTAAGFVRLWGLGLETVARRQGPPEDST